MSIEAPEIAARLNGRKTGSGWVARCPAHDDRNPSLSISEGDDGKPLLHCHAGCNFADVAEAVGLGKGNGADHRPAPKAKLATRPTGELTAIYPYVDEAGKLLYEVLRFGSGPGKTFSYRKPDGKGGYIGNIDNVRRVLYNLPKVIAADTVVIVEGEKDANEVTALGYTATSSKNFSEEHAAHFTGKDVYIIPDFDEAGAEIAEKAARCLHGIAATVKIITLPDLKPGGDVSDFIKIKGPDGADAELARLMVEAKAWLPDIEAAFSPPSFAELLSRPAERVEWLLHGLIPRGRVSLLSAYMKAGKSTFLGGLLTAIIEGREYVGQSTERTATLLITEELSADVKRRLRELGLGPTESLFIHGRDAGPLELQGDDIRRLKDFIISKGIGLLVIDTLSRFWTVENENDNGQVTAALKPILDLSVETGAAILLVVHDRKSEGEHGRQIRGAGALFANVDQALLLSRRQGGASTQRVLRTLGRYSESPEELLLDFENGRYVSLGDPQAADARTTEETILAAIKDPATREELIEATGLQGGSLRRALDNLTAGGMIKRTGTGKRGDPFTYQGREFEAL